MRRLLQFLGKRFFDKRFDNSAFEIIGYSQEGEDILLNRIFSNVQKGFYIDIGAHHPFRFSNTYFFYKLGWSGINIDPIPGVKQLFDQYRPNDINLEIAINDAKATLTYYNFKEKALNTFSEPLAEKYQKASWELEGVIPIETFPLAEILYRFLPAKKMIDFMSIDVEGLEMNVLRSNDWEKYRPGVLLIEMLDCKIEQVMDTEIGQYLALHGYVFFAKTVNTFFFKFGN
jgi:FkbM family methyltransferase